MANIARGPGILGMYLIRSDRDGSAARGESPIGRQGINPEIFTKEPERARTRYSGGRECLTLKRGITLAGGRFQQSDPRQLGRPGGHSIRAPNPTRQKLLLPG
jgi:hypothetical protein